MKIIILIVEIMNEIFINVFKCLLVCYVLLVGSYAFEEYYIEHLSDYWDIMPDEMFVEEIKSILIYYDKNINDYEIDEFLNSSRILYKYNIGLRIKLYKCGLKNRFIKYFEIK